MNKIFKIKTLVCVLAVGMISGCSNEEVDSGPGAVHPVVISERIAAGTNDFAIDFFKKLQNDENPKGDNLFVSPLSLHIALGMLLNGAEGETATEILKALKMEGVSVAELNEAYATLMNEMPLADSKVSLGLANSIWYRNDVQVETDFKNVLDKSFNAEVTGLEFNNAAKDRINKWASDKTNGKITKVLDNIDPGAVMFLLNALYFKGDWANKFDAKNTIDKPFHLASGTDKSVKMMHEEASYAVSNAEKYVGVHLPYGNGQFQMTLIVPNNQNNITEIMDSFTTENWTKMKSDTFKSNIILELPRFKLQYSKKLNDVARNLGINRAFVGAAQFDKISRTTDMSVGFIRQDTYLGIDEKGTEAAAVTTIGMLASSAGPTQTRQIVCDHPFGIVISEKTSNTILFMGRIMNPESN